MPAANDDIDELLPISVRLSFTYLNIVLPPHAVFQRTYLSHPAHPRLLLPNDQQNVQKRDWAHVVDITQPMPEYDLLKEGGGLAKAVRVLSKCSTLRSNLYFYLHTS